MRFRWMLVALLVSGLTVMGCGSSELPAEIAEDPIEASTEDPAPPSASDDVGGSDPGWSGPDFTVTTFNGESFTLSAQAGHPVVINFWESW